MFMMLVSHFVRGRHAGTHDRATPVGHSKRGADFGRELGVNERSSKPGEENTWSPRSLHTET
jgi:hypothetical protein